MLKSKKTTIKARKTQGGAISKRPFILSSVNTTRHDPEIYNALRSIFRDDNKTITYSFQHDFLEDFLDEFVNELSGRERKTISISSSSSFPNNSNKRRKNRRQRRKVRESKVWHPS